MVLIDIDFLHFDYSPSHYKPCFCLACCTGPPQPKSYALSGHTRELVGFASKPTITRPNFHAQDTRTRQDLLRLGPAELLFDRLFDIRACTPPEEAWLEATVFPSLLA